MSRRALTDVPAWIAAAVLAAAYLVVDPPSADLAAQTYRTGLFERAIYVERATMAQERIVPLPDLPDNFDAPYFSLIIVPGRGRRV